MEVEGLTIWSWNSRGLYNKLSEFKVAVYTKKPHLICLQETYIKDNFLPVLVNYQGYFKNRHGRGGGVAVFVRDDLVVNVNRQLRLYPNGLLEIQLITIRQGNQDIDIINFYNSGHTITRLEMQHYIGQLSRRFIMVGDYNAHHPIWSSRSQINTTGRNLADLILQGTIYLVTNKGMPTYLDSNTGRTSTLDLCFVPMGIQHLTGVTLGDDMGSDHCPLYVTVNVIPTIVTAQVRKRWKFKENKWEDFVQQLPELPDADHQDMDHRYKRLTDNMKNTAMQVFGMTSGIRHPKYNKPWWDEECEAAVAERRRLRNIANRRPLEVHQRRWNEANEIVKQLTAEKKQKWKKESAAEINSRTPVSQVWAKINAIRRTPTKTNRSIIYNDNIITGNKDKAEAFRQHFETIYNIERESQVAEANWLQIDEAIDRQRDEGYNKIFTIKQLDDTIAR